MSVWIYMCTCSCVHVCARSVCGCARVSVSGYVRAHARVGVHMCCVCACEHMSVRVCACVSVCVRVHMCVQSGGVQVCGCTCACIAAPTTQG